MSNHLDQLYYNDPDSDLLITLRYPDPEHPHQLYKVTQSNVSKHSKYFEREIHGFQNIGESGPLTIEIKHNLDHDSFDELMKYMCTKDPKEPQVTFAFDTNHIAELYQTAFYLEIPTASAFLLKKILEEVALSKSNIWVFLVLGYNLQTSKSKSKNLKIQELTLTFLKSNNFRSLAGMINVKGRLSHLDITDFLSIFKLHKTEREVSKDKHFYLTNANLVSIAEEYCSQKFSASRSDSKANFKLILEQILAKDELSQEETLAFKNFDLFFILKQHQKFESESNSQWNEIQNKIEALERDREENAQSLNTANFDSLIMDKIGIKNELITKISNLEFDEQRQKQSLERRIDLLESDNKQLFSELKTIFDNIQNYVGLNSEEIRSQGVIIKNEIQRIQRDEKFKVIPDSSILTEKSRKRLLGWIKEKEKADTGLINQMGKMLSGGQSAKLSLYLLYKATRDGGNSESFHKHCDGKARTLVLIQSECGNLFGGFTSSAAWTSDEGFVSSDGKSFIFSLDHKILMPISDLQKAIYCRSDYGPTFGAGNEIFLSKEFTKDSGSHTNINGTTYTQPKLEGGLSLETFMGGSFHFKVLEVEVFQLMESV